MWTLRWTIFVLRRGVSLVWNCPISPMYPDHGAEEDDKPDQPDDAAGNDAIESKVDSCGQGFWRSVRVDHGDSAT